MPSTLKYPVIRRDENYFDSYHGRDVADPYNWLEDPDSEETRRFVEAENEITTEYLKSCKVKEKFFARYSLKSFNFSQLFFAQWTAFINIYLYTVYISSHGIHPLDFLATEETRMLVCL